MQSTIPKTISHLIMDNSVYTFDDILILPAYSDLEREDVDIHSYFHWYCLSVPVMSSPMDTITEIKMMDAIYKAGGFGFHHRYCLIETLTNLRYIPGGIAVSPSMGIDTILSLYSANKDSIFIVDVAHGHTKKNLDFCAELIKNGCVVVSGNVATPWAVAEYVNIGVRDFRVGIGSGSVCTTRTVAGIGAPQASTIKWIRNEYPDGEGVSLISDGGHRTTADIVKALALGADFVMLGGMLSGCLEVPTLGKKVYRGMASRDARNNIDKYDIIPEGITKEINPRQISVTDILKEIEGSIKLACYYVGARNLQELRERSEIVFVTRK